MIAALPMYDWPEVRAETDALWAAIRDAMRAEGFAAPEALTRGADPWAVWRDPDLLLAQTCGLPYAARLAGDVTLLGAPAFAVEGCEKGEYRSAVIARADSGAESLDDLAGARFAFNMRESQSGWAALDRTTPIRAHFGDLVETGAHRASVAAVAEGCADCAAIDAVSWTLARRHEAAAAGLRVVAWTDPTPGLPYISARRHAPDAARLAGAVEAAVAALPPTVADALTLTGFRRWPEAAYAPLAAGWPD